MHDIESTTPSYRANNKEISSVSKSRETNTYNRTALAVEFRRASYPSAQPAPKLISYPAVTAQATPMFRGLDQCLSRRSKGTGFFSVLIHLLVAGALIWLGTMARARIVQTAETVVPIQFTLFSPPPPQVMPVAKVQGGGGGGGARHIIEPRRGRLPEIAKAPIILPDAPKIPSPTPLVAPIVQIKPPKDASIPKLGIAQSAQVTLASQGPGNGSGFGFGLGGGVGIGNGTGQGPGSNGGYGGGLMRVGGGVSAPRVIYSVAPQFTPEARQADYQGAVSIQLIVDSQGYPQDIRVVRHLGMGLDERAVAAVRQYRFSPAMYQGHPVSVQMIIDVDFHLHG